MIYETGGDLNSRVNYGASKWSHEIQCQRATRNVSTSHKQDWTHQVVSWYVESDFLFSLGHVRRLRGPIEQVQDARFVVTCHLVRQPVRALNRQREQPRISRRALRSESRSGRSRKLVTGTTRMASLCIQLDMRRRRIYSRIAKDTAVCGPINVSAFERPQHPSARKHRSVLACSRYTVEEEWKQLNDADGSSCFSSESRLSPR